MAKITIQKKTETNPYKELSLSLNIPDLEAKFPKQWDEPWRRFDPVKLIPSMITSAKNGFAGSLITGNSLSKSMKLASSAAWKSENEIFHKKVEKNSDAFSKMVLVNFFEDYLHKTQNPEDTWILRISASQGESEGATPVTTPAPSIEIKPSDKTKFTTNKLVIYCEENSNSTLNIIKQSAAFDLSAIYVYQEKNSNLKLRILDENLGDMSYGVSLVKSFQEKNSISDIGAYNTSEKNQKKVFVKNLLMENAVTRYSGIFTGKFSHVDHDFQIKHQENYAKSDVLFKMAVLDDAYGVFWGDTEIIPGTRGCEGYQKNKNVLLGVNARVDAIPRLRIQTEHVMAAHGSATGEISDEEIFYMMSRGLSYDEARKLLLRGFFEDVLRQSFGTDPDLGDAFLSRIWNNIQQILGTDIST